MKNLLSTLKRNYISYWINGFNFAGTANRREYWQPVIINASITALLPLFGVPLLVSTALGFIFIFPSLSITMRRLRDAGESKWWAYLPLANSALKILPKELYIVLGLIWMAGNIYLIFLLSKPSSTPPPRHLSS